jgi:DNA-binding CsgD family transcriptional regulator
MKFAASPGLPVPVYLAIFGYEYGTNTVEGYDWLAGGKDTVRAALANDQLNMFARGGTYLVTLPKPTMFQRYFEILHFVEVPHAPSTVWPMRGVDWAGYVLDLTQTGVEQWIESIISDEPAGAAAGDVSAPPTEAAALLSQRELEVARLVALGQTNQEIAHSLVVSVRTAETYVARILRKLNLHSRVQLATWAMQLPN